jgi:hypothetical protein
MKPLTLLHPYRSFPARNADHRVRETVIDSREPGATYLSFCNILTKGPWRGICTICANLTTSYTSKLSDLANQYYDGHRTFRLG